MTERGKKRVIAFCAAAASIYFGWSLFGDSLRKTPERFVKLPAFQGVAVDSTGHRELSLEDLRGRPFVVDFIFTRCGGPCPLLSQGMAKLQRRLPSEVRLVSFTVDPDRDNIETLRRYANRFSAEPGRWIFVRMEKADLYELVFAGFKLPVMENVGAGPANRVTHSTKLVLVDASGTIRGYYNGAAESSLKRIERDVLLLRTASEENRV